MTPPVTYKTRKNPSAPFLTPENMPQEVTNFNFFFLFFVDTVEGKKSKLILAGFKKACKMELRVRVRARKIK